MAASESSSAQQARKVLADRLRELSLNAGLNGKRLAAACGWHPSKVSRIASAKTVPSADDIGDWCRACGAEEHIDDLVAALRSVESTWVIWGRMERSGLRRAQQSRLPLYERTRWFRAYLPGLFPGLVQTHRYTEDVLRAVQRRRVPIDDVAQAVAARIERQRVLLDGRRRFAFIVEQCVLFNALGGAEVHAEQLKHVLAASVMPNVSIGIVPARLGRCRMSIEGFWIFDAEQVNVELVSGYLTIRQPSEVAMYADAFAMLADMAVYGASARKLIAEALGSLV